LQNDRTTKNKLIVAKGWRQRDMIGSGVELDVNATGSSKVFFGGDKVAPYHDWDSVHK
jgi:hypothetical protein